MATYSTTPEVKKEAGMFNNDCIADTLVDKYREEAYSLIRSRIACRYSLSAMLINFSGSDAENVLKRIEEYYAAGYLLTKEYGHNDDGNDEDGVDKLARADAMLESIVKGELKLLDSDGNEFSQDTSGLSSVTVAGFPTSATATNSDGVEIDRKFSISMQF